MQDRTRGLIPKEAKDRTKYLLNQNMKGMRLGDCLNSINQRLETGVIYRASPAELVGFIAEWMRQNPGYDKNWEGHIELELPYIKGKTCPRSNTHEEKTLDHGGRTRCAHVQDIVVEGEEMRQEYDKHSGITCNVPIGETIRGRPNMNRHCYAIIDEPERLKLPLETVIRRLSTTKRPSLASDDEQTTFQMDGWALAGYVQKWWQQDGARIYK